MKFRMSRTIDFIDLIIFSPAYQNSFTGRRFNSGCLANTARKFRRVSGNVSLTRQM